MPLNSEGSRPKDEIPKQDPDMAACQGWGAGTCPVPVREGSRAARQPCRNSKKSTELLMKAPQRAPRLFLGEVQPIVKCCRWREVHGAFCHLRDAVSSRVQPRALRPAQLCPKTHTPALPSRHSTSQAVGSPCGGSAFCTAPAVPQMNVAPAGLAKGITGSYSAPRSH